MGNGSDDSEGYYLVTNARNGTSNFSINTEEFFYDGFSSRNVTTGSPVTQTSPDLDEYEGESNVLEADTGTSLDLTTSNTDHPCEYSLNNLGLSNRDHQTCENSIHEVLAPDVYDESDQSDEDSITSPPRAPSLCDVSNLTTPHNTGCTRGFFVSRKNGGELNVNSILNHNAEPFFPYIRRQVSHLNPCAVPDIPGRELSNRESPNDGVDISDSVLELPDTPPSVNTEQNTLSTSSIIGFDSSPIIRNDLRTPPLSPLSDNEQTDTSIVRKNREKKLRTTQQVFFQNKTYTYKFPRQADHSDTRVRKKGVSIQSNVKQEVPPLYCREVCVESQGSFGASDADDAITILNEIRMKYLKNVIIGHLNINSLRNKFHALCYLIQGKLDILVVGETKLDYSFPEKQFMIKGYKKPYRLDRNKYGGGVMIYVREDMS